MAISLYSNLVSEESSGDKLFINLSHQSFSVRPLSGSSEHLTSVCWRQLLVLLLSLITWHGDNKVDNKVMIVAQVSLKFAT